MAAFSSTTFASAGGMDKGRGQGRIPPPRSDDAAYASPVFKAMVGSGWTVTAPIAVKCKPQIASVRRPLRRHSPRFRSSG
jgi:hypothetical protein